VRDYPLSTDRITDRYYTLFVDASAVDEI